MPDNLTAITVLVPTLQPIQAVLFLLLLFAVAVCDLHLREIPDSLQLAIAAISLLCFSPGNLLGILGAAPYMVVALFWNDMDGIGGGDIKLAATTGMVLGLSASLLSSVIGLSTFILYSIVYMTVRKLHGKQKNIAFPVGPFLALGAVIAYFLKMGGITL